MRSHVLTASVWSIIPPCLFHRMTGYYCPGCGATRCVYALLHGRIGEALFYYPAIPVGLLLLIWMCVSLISERIAGHRVFFHFPMRRIWLYVILALILGNFVWKNAVLIFTGTALME